MKKEIEEFSKTKKFLIYKARTVMDDALLKAFVSTLEDCENYVFNRVKNLEDEVENKNSENEVLRGLIGVKDESIQSEIIKKSQEVDYLRRQLLSTKTEFDKKVKTIDSHKEEIELKKIEINSISENKLKSDEKYKKQLDMLSHKLGLLESAYSKEEDGLNKEKSEISKKIASIEKRFNTEKYKEFYSLAKKLRDITGIVLGSSEFMLENYNASKSSEGAGAKRSVISKLIKHSNGSLDAVYSDIMNISAGLKDMVMILDSYKALLEIDEPKIVKLNWIKTRDYLNQKFMSYIINKKISIFWPTEKKVPAYYTDEKYFVEICENIIQNALDSLPPEGVLDVSGKFEESQFELCFSDNGDIISKEVSKNMFLPFCSTKDGHLGLGLTRSMYLARAIEGEITYSDSGNNNRFTLLIKSIKK